MKGFFDMFAESAKALKDLRSLITASLLLAMAIALKSISVDITPDLRIGFSFLPIAVTAMLYGPVVCGASSVLLDLLGYIISNKSARAYSPQLALVVLLAGVIYGIILYHCEFRTGKETAISTLKIFGACLAVAVICNICLNSYFLYTLYVNKDFSLFDSSGWKAFGAYCIPRVIKNFIEFPIRGFILMAVLPMVKTAYDKVQKQFGKKAA